MLHLANFSIRRPKVALAIWTIVAAVLIGIGLGVTDKLSPNNTLVEGTSSARATALAESKFGPSVLVPVLLEGPRAQLDRQGPALVRKLTRRNDTRVLSAWDAGDAGHALRPSPTEAMLVASVARSEPYMVDKGQAQLDRAIDGSLSHGVVARISGTATLDRAINDEAVSSARKAMLAAIPLIFLALLIALRAPVAALAGMVNGGVTAFAGFGVMSLVAKFFDADGIGLALGSLMGVALGTAMALLILDRFRAQEESHASRRASAAAASAVIGGTGRAVLLAGTGLVIALMLATAFGPTKNLNSIGIGSVICALLAMGGAVVVMPALLVLMGTRLFAGSFAVPWALAAPWRRLVGAEGLVLRRAVYVGAAATALLAALAVPVLQMKTGPPDPSFLPSDNRARTDFEAIQRTMGPGWPTPYNIVVASNSRPVTDQSLLRELDRFQVQIAKDKMVASVAGPGTFRAKTSDLGTLKTQLDKSKKLLKGAPKDLGKLEGGLGQAGVGAVQLQGGLKQAASGAGQLESGGGSAKDGARRLREGLAAARAGSAKISGGLNQALGGANALKTGSGQALAGAKQLSGGLGQAAPTVKQSLPIIHQMANDVAASSNAVNGASASAKNLSAQLGTALAQLQAMGVGKTDPHYKSTLAALQQAGSTAGGLNTTLSGTTAKLGTASAVAGAFAGQVETLSGGLDKLYAGSNQLTAGVTRLKNGNTDLAAGIGQLSGGGSQLTSGLGQLQNGAGQLEAGLGQLQGGAGQLGSGISGGIGPVGQLAGGLGLMKSGVVKFRGSMPSAADLERLQAQSPGLFDSGYFVLAAIEGAPQSDRNQAAFAVNLERGGSAGQITVISKHASKTKATQELGERLVSMSNDFAKRTRTQTAVGGPAGELADFQSDISSKIWPVVLGVSLGVTLFLMAALRSVLVPLVTAAFNLLATAATFGGISLLTRGSDPVLGGPGYVDSLQVIETFAAVFGIALLSELPLLWRTRELYMAGSTPHEALAEALRDTAGAATAAAAVIVAAVLPFLFSGLFNLRLTIGMAIVIVIDALLVRPVLLPAATQLLGRRGWWPSQPRSAEPKRPDRRPPTRFRRVRRPRQPEEVSPR